MPLRRRFKLYALRRPDKQDPIEPENWCPFYGGRGKKNREKSHRKEALKLLKDPNAKNSNPIRNAIIHKLWSQGLDYVEEIIVDNLTDDEANELEIDFIAAYGRIDLGTGCLSNQTDGGKTSTGFKFSEEQKQKLRGPRPCMSGENNPMYGVPSPNKGVPMPEEQKQKRRIPCSEEKKIKLSIAHTGKVLTKEHCQHISESCKGRVAPNKGVPCPEEQKKQISITLTGTTRSKEANQKTSESMMGEKNHFYHKQHSEESKHRISESKKGKKLGPQSEEHKKKKSESLKLYYQRKREQKLAEQITSQEEDK